MNFILRPVEALLQRLSLERKVLVLLGFSMGLVMLVSAVLMAWGVLVYYELSVSRSFDNVQAELGTALKRQVAQSQRIVSELAADSTLALRLDSITALYGRRDINAADFIADQQAIVLRLAHVGFTLKALVVAYDRDGEPLGYFDSRGEHFAMGRFTSPLFGQITTGGAEPLPTNAGAGPLRPVLRSELALPAYDRGLLWRMVDGELTQAAVAPVVAQFDDKRRQVGYVGIFVTKVSEDIKEAAAREGFETLWLLPGNRRLGDVTQIPEDEVLREAPDLATQVYTNHPVTTAASLGRFGNWRNYGRAFALSFVPEFSGGRGRLILLHDKATMRLRALLVFLAALFVPLLACALAAVPCLRLARRYIVKPVVELAGEIDAVKDGRYVRNEAEKPMLPENDEVVHVHRVLGELADELGRRERESWIWTSVFRKTREAIFVTDLEGNVVYVNQAFTDVSGTTEEEAVDRPASFLRTGLHDEAFYEEMWQALRVHGHWAGEVWDQRRDGTAYPQWLSMSPVTNRDGAITNYAGIFSDISERKAQEERISYMAHHDTLTGLPNRAMLMERLRVALLHAEREGHQVAVLFIDLDRFKIINDTLGHSVGDGLLQTVAERLKRAVRASDTVSRLGGDEFIVMLYKVRSIQDAERVAEHILGVLAPTARVEGHELAITPSIGIAAYPENGVDADELIRNADVAMYHAKAQGRNNYQLFEPSLSETAVESLSLEHALRCAADRDEFTLYYQPQIEVATRKLVGVEALIRWESEEFGVVPPGKFIRIAEECGLILQIGDWVLRESCRQRAEWNADGIGSFPVAVNVSALQFRQPEFVRRVEEAMQLYGIKAEQLELELTESIVMHESGVTAAALEKLKTMGISLAIDDFGTGYSSLGYLKHLPIQKLKVDGSFIRGIETDKADRAIVEAIVSLGRALNLTLVAEGVEQRSTITLLGKLGCHVAQGYLYCRPLPPEDFVAWYREFCGEGKRLSVA
ncbi:EAL domain-containing protein [Uliginosibacterium sp. H3]|uniref:EAL domain-containing protein n=1 Tax=Uliginosibacterium silvisoli TaxID=3114758 RepID=A0ABU6K4F6_9RHOO|nr:EAL domain-containing protein [Uliginosibacterium sp. H3]